MTFCLLNTIQGEIYVLLIRSVLPVPGELQPQQLLRHQNGKQLVLVRAGLPAVNKVTHVSLSLSPFLSYWATLTVIWTVWVRMTSRTVRPGCNPLLFPPLSATECRSPPILTPRLCLQRHKLSFICQPNHKFCPLDAGVPQGSVLVLIYSSSHLFIHHPWIIVNLIDMWNDTIVYCVTDCEVCYWKPAIILWKPHRPHLLILA